MTITVFTYGDPTQEQSEKIGDWIAHQADVFGGTILGRNSGTGRWGDETETCGSIVVADLSLSLATFIGRLAAIRFDQDAVGVVHSADGRTLATPDSDTLKSAEEVWSQ